MKDVIGWASSLVLVLTIAKQVHKQWRAGTSEGVSQWLYVGQLVASAGFTVYSVLVRDWVFVVTNGVLTLSAVAGAVIFFHHRRGDRRKAKPDGSQRASRPTGPS